MPCRFSLFPHFQITFPSVVLDFKLFIQNIPNKMISKENLKIEKPTISDKNCETCTPSPLIQCWLQICLLISGLHGLAWLLHAWHNIESRGKGDSGQL